MKSSLLPAPKGAGFFEDFFSNLPLHPTPKGVGFRKMSKIIINEENSVYKGENLRFLHL